VELVQATSQQVPVLLVPFGTCDVELGEGREVRDPERRRESPPPAPIDGRGKCVLEDAQLIPSCLALIVFPLAVGICFIIGKKRFIAHGGFSLLPFNFNYLAQHCPLPELASLEVAYASD
jgi:hypothetical protein